MKWAIGLQIDNKVSIEKRMNQILTHLFKSEHEYTGYIFDLDATGFIGDQLTRKINYGEKPLCLNQVQLLELTNENGQIFELDLLLSNSEKYKIIIRSGDSLDLLGDGEKLPNDRIGNYIDLDIGLFT